MDENFPNQLVGSGKNCYVNTSKQYNDFFKTNIKLENLMNTTINLCSSFLVEKSEFEKIIQFIEYVIESKILDQFDAEHKHRFQGGMIERYIGLYSSQIKIYQFDLTHLYQKYK